MEVVPVRAEMIVDDVEDHHQAALMGGIDEPLQAFRAAIGAVRRIKQHAVIAPAAFAGELRDGHQLDGGDAEIDQMVELCLDAARMCLPR